jgi:hypothetical protein
MFRPGLPRTFYLPRYTVYLLCRTAYLLRRRHGVAASTDVEECLPGRWLGWRSFAQYGEVYFKCLGCTEIWAKYAVTRS